MRSLMRKKFSALVIIHALLLASLPLRAQDTTQTHTRPRRVTTTTEQPPPTVAQPTTQSVETSGTEQLPQQPQPTRITREPFVRIGLATNARSVTISTGGQLLNATDTSAAPVPFDVARVRIEPRSLPSITTPPPSDDGDALNASTDADLIATTDGETLGNLPSDSASAKRAGETPAKTSEPTKPFKIVTRAGGQSGVRLSSRVSVPLRGAVLYTPGSTKPLLDVRAPVLFASDDEAQNPVRYNEKPYRGRLEVFPNLRGTLTVVNVVSLEEYVRGVVPNELSPGGYPELEALKAQAVAARTYAISHLGQFAAEGFDLLPTTRSQVYGGRATEHPLTDRAVAETRGRIATFQGRPIDALYTSTCGGRTEDAQNIFGGQPVAYLRGRECAIDGHESFTPFIVRTSRELPSIAREEHAASAREAALLSTYNFALPARLTDEWLAAPVNTDEVRVWLGRAALLARQATPPVTIEATRPPAFSTALALALDGESRADVLLDRADIDYLLSFRDAEEIPAANRADVALLVREGHLSLYADATLRPRQTMSRARMLHTLAHALEARGLISLQTATMRPATGTALVLRQAGKGGDRSLNVATSAFLFRAYGANLYPVRELNLVGGEALSFHLDARGEIDYLEMRPAASGAAADHVSPFANWTETLGVSAVMSRLGRSVGGIGSLVDLRVRARGSSRRVLDLEVTGTTGTAHVRGGRIRSALGLREQLFVIDRIYDETGRVKSFVFTGRGWGHGVGMCQVGAFGLARSGLTYDKILKTYYTGISLTKLY